MNALKKIALAVLILSFFVFIALFGSLPALRKTPVGFLNRFIWKTLPAALRSIDASVTGGRLGASLSRWGTYFMDENHPAILIFYISVLSGAIVVFLPAAYSQISNFQLALAVLLCVLPYYFTYKTVTSTSSVITAQNHRRELQRYPYDHALYKPGRACRTCHFLKPARSKHCSICNVCVSKHDHHCVWVMNCVGKGNAFYFMAMMASLGALLNYGSLLAYLVTSKTIRTEVARETGNLDPNMNWSAGKTWSEYGEFHLWAFAQDFRVGAVGLLAFMCGPLAWALFFYHTYLVWAGMTTNETSKWADWRDDIADGIVFKTNRSIAERDSRDSEIEPFVDWPILNSQQLLRIEDGITQQPWANGHNKSPFGKDALKRVKDLGEIENLYDLGFWDNMKDMAPI